MAPIWQHGAARFAPECSGAAALLAPLRTPFPRPGLLNGLGDVSSARSGTTPRRLAGSAAAELGLLGIWAPQHSWPGTDWQILNAARCHCSRRLERLPRSFPTSRRKVNRQMPMPTMFLAVTILAPPRHLPRSFLAPSPLLPGFLPASAPEHHQSAVMTGPGDDPEPPGDDRW